MANDNSPGDEERCHGPWRDGWLLVVAPGAHFPPRCPISNLPTGGRYIRQDLTSSPPASVHLAHFIHPTLGWVISASKVQRFIFSHPIAPQAVRQRLYRRVVPLLMVVAALGCFVAGALRLVGGPVAFWFIWGGMMGGVLGACWLVSPFRFLALKHTEYGYAWLSGASPAYLASLPDWPGWDD